MSGRTRVPAQRDGMTAEWFDGLAQGRLLLRKCTLGHHSRPDALSCDLCGALNLAWVQACGRGSVVALAADHSTEPVTCLAVVELDEGPWLFTRVEGALAVRGQDVVVRCARNGEGEAYPVVVPHAPEPIDRTYGL